MYCLPRGSQKLLTYHGFRSPTRMPSSPDTGMGMPPRARRGWVNPHGLGSVMTPLIKHVRPRCPVREIGRLGLQPSVEESETYQKWNGGTGSLRAVSGSYPFGKTQKPVAEFNPEELRFLCPLCGVPELNRLTYTALKLPVARAIAADTHRSPTTPEGSSKLPTLCGGEHNEKGASSTAPGAVF